MTEENIPTPPLPSPAPEKKDTVTLNKKNLAIAFLAVALFILVIVLIIPGDKSSAPVTTDPAPVVTNPPVTSPPKNKYDDYVNHVLNNSGQANNWSKAKLIEFGDVVCETLDNGSSIRSVVNMMESYAANNSDVEFFASVAMGSIYYICPEYIPALNAYLGN